MAACSPTDGEGVESDNISSSLDITHTKFFRNNSQVKVNHSSASVQSISLDGEKAYDTVANFEEGDLRNFLEEVVSIKRSKTDKSAIAQILIRKEEDALREESGSGEDSIEQALRRQKKKRSNWKRDHCVGGACSSGSTAASCNNTGGSLGSLHDLSDPKLPEQKSNTTQGVASRSRAGGSCGNLSKGSFETRVCKRKSRKSKEVAKASSSQREGGSLQNLSKTEAASSDSKRLHKSGSLSQVFPENRRQKTSSESSGNQLYRRSEERDAETSDEDATTIPYQPLLPVPQHSSLSVDLADGHGMGVVGAHWNRDPSSDGASGETTEDDGEMMHLAARSKLGESSRHHYSCQINDSDTELHTITTHTAHRDLLPTISSDSDVDKPINFCFNKSQEDTMITSTTPLLSKPSYVASMLDEKSTLKDEDVVEKRKLRNTKSDSGSFEKSSLDENGNPVLMAVRSTLSCSNSNNSGSLSSLQNSTTDRHVTALSTVGKRNGFNGQSKDISAYDRLKAKQDKKKANKEKDVIVIEKTPGFRGNDNLDSIFKYLGLDNTSNSKVKKKKGKKEDSKEEVKKCKGKVNEDGISLNYEDDALNNKGKGSNGMENKDDNRKNNGKRNRENDKKRGNSNGSLRESSSMEDLVSKSKQNEGVKDVRKQMTVDDGDVDFGDRLPYNSCHSKQSVELNRSEFSYDFYRIGDPIMDSSVNSSSEIGDFEVVNRRKGKKSKNSVSQASKYGGSGGLNDHLGSTTSYQEDHRRSTFPRSGGISNKTSQKHLTSQDKPQINFSEVPRTMHEGTFISQWGGSRSGGQERGFTTTTSAPHSEDSDSDGGDSVHSMPAHTIIPSSTESTPQTSYANIAKLAASAKPQEKKKAYVGSPPAIPFCSPEEDPEKNYIEDAELQELKNESGSSILDDNFPPLSETLNSPPLSVIGSNKINDKEIVENCSTVNSDNSCKKEIKSPATEVNTSQNKLSDKITTGNPNNKKIYSPQATVIFNNTKIGPVPPLNASFSSTGSFSLPSTLPSPLPSTNSLPNIKPTVPNSLTINSSVNPNNKKSQSARQITTVTKPATNNKPSSSIFTQNSDSLCNNNSAKSSRNVSNSVIFTNETINRNSKNSNSKEAKTNNNNNRQNKNSNKDGIIENGNVRFKHFEEAVIFTDNAMFDHSVTGIEFGFDMSLENLTDSTAFEFVDNTSCNNKKMNSLPIDKNSSGSIEKCKNNNETDNRNIKNLNQKDFSKLFKPPINDVISYNYEELCKHVSKAWELTLRMLEEDPKNIQYWRATE